MVVYNTDIIIFKYMVEKQQYDSCTTLECLMRSMKDSVNSLPKDKKIKIIVELGFNNNITIYKKNQPYSFSYSNINTICEWCEEFLQDDVVLDETYSFVNPWNRIADVELNWYFKNPKDAMLFKLKWV